MLDDVPAGDLAVFGFFEMVALGFVLEGIGGLERGEYWWKWLGSLFLGLLFFVAGIKWPKIKRVLGGRFSDVVERVAVYRPLFVIGAIAYVVITRHDLRYRYVALALGATYLIFISAAYVQTIRRDLDRYVMPRQITSRQARRLRTFLSRHPAFEITVKVNPHDPEAMQYASQISQALKLANWAAELDISPPYSPEDAIGINATGVNSIAAYGKDDPRPILQNAFSFAGIVVNRGGGIGAGKFAVSIVVGRRSLVCCPINKWQ